VGGRVLRVSGDLVPDDRWERVDPDDRAALRGIIYVLRKSVTWADVPTEMIGCIGVTCWRRLQDRTEAGVWPRLHSSLNSAGQDCRTWTTPRPTARTSRGLKRRSLGAGDGITPDLPRSTAAARAPSTM
jgi:transposase